MPIEPYLFFEGRCDEALAFYRATLGAEVTLLMRFRDSPAEMHARIPAERMDKVMHARAVIGDAVLLASDGNCSGEMSVQGVALSLTLADTAAARRTFDALAAEGQVRMAFSPTFFSPGFGVVADKFGVPWMVMAAG